MNKTIKPGFVCGTVFDVSQTDELGAKVIEVDAATVRSDVLELEAA